MGSGGGGGHYLGASTFMCVLSNSKVKTDWSLIDTTVPCVAYRVMLKGGA